MLGAWDALWTARARARAPFPPSAQWVHSTASNAPASFAFCTTRASSAFVSVLQGEKFACLYQNAHTVNECLFLTRSKKPVQRNHSYQKAALAGISFNTTAQRTSAAQKGHTVVVSCAVQHAEPNSRILQQCKTVAFQYLRGAYKRAREKLLTTACNRIRGNGFKTRVVLDWILGKSSLL